MDESMQRIFESQNLSQVLMALRAKVMEACSGAGTRQLDGSVSGLDGVALREVLDRLFGEHTTAQCPGIANWVYACDYVPYGLFKHLNDSPSTSDKVEVRAPWEQRTRARRPCASPPVAHDLSPPPPPALFQHPPRPLRPCAILRRQLNTRIAGMHLQELCLSAVLLSELLTPNALHAPKDARSLYSVEALRVLVRRDVLPEATQRVLRGSGGAGDCALAVRMDPLLRILAERHSARFKAPFVPPAPRGFGRGEAEGDGAASSYSAAGQRAGFAFPVSGSDAALLYTLNYLSTPNPKWREPPSASQTTSGADLAHDAETRLCIEPLWCMRMGLEPVREIDVEAALPVPLRRSATSGAPVLGFLTPIIAWVEHKLRRSRRSGKAGAAAAEDGSSVRQTLYLHPPSLLNMRVVMDSLFWQGEAYGSAHPPVAAGEAAAGSSSSSSSSSSGAPSEDPFSTCSTHRLFLTAAIRYLLLNNPMYLVPLPGQAQAELGPGSDRWAPSFPSFSAPWDAAGADAPGMRSAGQGQQQYLNPRADTLQALAVLFTQQICDKTFHLVTAGGQGALRTASSAGATPVHGLAHGKPLWARALEYVRRSSSSSSVGGGARPLSPAAWSLWAELSRGRGAGGGLLREGEDMQATHFPFGMYVMPETLCEMHAPLFHFLRTHLERAPLGNEGGGGGGGSGSSSEAPARNAVTFSAVVDLWLMVLTPWRGRPRYKNLLPVAAAEGEESGRAPGLRAFRAFNYTDAASDALKRAVVSARDAQVQSWRARERASGRGPHPSEPYDVNDDDVATQLQLSKAKLGSLVREGAEFQALLGATLDFKPTAPPMQSKARGAPAAPQAPQQARVTDDPLGASFPSTLPFASFSSWVPAHYAFYTHLLGIFLRRMSRAGLAVPAEALPTEALVRASGGVGGRPLACPPNPVLLEALEHVLDVFSLPELRDTLAETAGDVEALWPASGGGGGGGVGGQQLPQQPPSPPTRTAAEKRRELSRRTLLLAHVHMLNLPPSVHPCAVLPPAFARVLPSAAPAPNAPPSVRGSGDERGLRCCTGPGEALQHAEDVSISLAAAGNSLVLTTTVGDLPGIVLPHGTCLQGWEASSPDYVKRSRICAPFNLFLRCCPRPCMSWLRWGIGLAWVSVPALPWGVLWVALFLVGFVRSAFRVFYGHEPLPLMPRVDTLLAGGAPTTLVPPTVAAAMPSPTRRLGPDASFGGGGLASAWPLLPSPSGSTASGASASASASPAPPYTTSYTDLPPVPHGSPAAVLRFADRLALAQDRTGLLFCGKPLSALPAPAHWRLERIPPPWYQRLGRALQRLTQFVLGIGSRGQYRPQRSNNEDFVQRHRPANARVTAAGASSGASRSSAGRRSAGDWSHSAATPLHGGIVANSWESASVLRVLVAVADALRGPQLGPMEEGLEWTLRCAADVRTMAAVAALVAVCRDASLGWKWGLGGALGAMLVTRVVLLCLDGAA